MSDLALILRQTRYGLLQNSRNPRLADGLQRTLAATGGTGLDGGNVAVLAVWGLAGIMLAARNFRWEPQGSG